MLIQCGYKLVSKSWSNQALSIFNKAETNSMNVRYLFVKEYLYSLKYLLIDNHIFSPLESW